MHVPNKSYSGYYGGVAFRNGVGIFTDVEKAKELATRYGYEIVETKEEVTEVAKEVVVVEDVKPAPKKRTRKVKAGE